MSEATPVFYVPAEVPQKWTLYDVLLWVACKRLPESYWDEDGIEVRESYNVFCDHFLGIGDYVVDYLAEHDTKTLGVSTDPEIVNQKREFDGEEYLLDPEFYEIKFTLEDEEENANYILRQNRLQREAKNHKAYSDAWQQDLDERLDVYRSKIHIALCTNEIVAEGIMVDNSDDVDEVYKTIDKAIPNRQAYNDSFETIPKKGLMLNGVDWKASSIKIRDKLYLGVRFESSKILDFFPPDQGRTMDVFRTGHNLFTLDGYQSVIAASEAKRKTGRPPKDWEIIDLKTTEIVAEEGGLPRKQDALAHYLMEHYVEQTGQKIGISTIKARLKHYYQSPVLRKSQK